MYTQSLRCKCPPSREITVNVRRFVLRLKWTHYRQRVVVVWVFYVIQVFPCRTLNFDWLSKLREFRVLSCTKARDGYKFMLILRLISRGYKLSLHLKKNLISCYKKIIVYELFDTLKRVRLLIFLLHVASQVRGNSCNVALFGNFPHFEFSSNFRPLTFLSKLHIFKNTDSHWKGVHTCTRRCFDIFCLKFSRYHLFEYMISHRLYMFSNIRF